MLPSRNAVAKLERRFSGSEGVRSNDRVLNVKQGLLAAGLNWCLVALRGLRSAEKNNLLLAGAHVDLFHDLSVCMFLPATLPARSYETFFTVVQGLPAP